MKTVVIDYGMSNLGSIRQALEECGGDAYIIDDPKQLADATHIILPGVGAFKDGMKNLQQMQWLQPLSKAIIEDKIPILGICLGMQLLATKGNEGGESDGTNFIAGEVKKLEVREKNERIPHVGWNEIYKNGTNPLFEGIPDGTDFYFVHSYHFIPVDKNDIATTTPYCDGFVSSIRRENIFGVQFHPEKSQRPGFRLLKNFLAL